MTLGQRIQAGRTALGLSQETLGEQLGVSRQAVSRWEADGAVPDTDKLIALSRLFHMTLNELLQVEEPAEAPEGKRPEESPARGRRGQPWAMTALAAGLALALIFSQIQLRRLESRVEVMEGQAALGAEIDPAELVAISYCDFELEKGLVTGGYAFASVDLLPERLHDDLEIQFVLKGSGSEGKTVTAEGKQESGHYTARLALREVSGPFTVSALFTLDGKQYTRALVRVESWGADYYAWDPLWKE